MVSTQSRNHVAIAAVAALIGAFALTFVLGKSSKHSSASATPGSAVQVVAMPSQKPKVTGLQTDGALPALRSKPHKAKPKQTTSGSSSTQTNQSQTQTGTAQSNPTQSNPTPSHSNPPSGGNNGGSDGGGGQVIGGGGTQ